MKKAAPTSRFFVLFVYWKFFIKKISPTEYAGLKVFTFGNLALL